MCLNVSESAILLIFETLTIELYNTNMYDKVNIC